MRMKKIAVLLLAVVLAVAGLSGCKGGNSGSGGISSGSAVFKIGKEKCSVTEAKILLMDYQNQYRDVYGVDLWKASDGDNQELESYIKDLAISQLAEIYLMAYIGTDQEMELSEDEMAHVEAAAEVYFNTLNDAEKDYLGASQKDVESLYEHYAMARKVFATLTEGVSHEVSDDDARVMSVIQIVTDDETIARIAYSKIQGGSDFSTVAASYGESGNINVTIDRTAVPDSIEEEVFALSNEEYTSILESGDNYVIYYCVNNYEEELTQENKEAVLQQRMEEAVNTTYESYAASTDSKLYTDTWSKVNVNTDEAIVTTSFFDVFEEYCGGDY